MWAVRMEPPSTYVFRGIPCLHANPGAQARPFPKGTHMDGNQEGSRLVFGFDFGIASIGFAALDDAKQEVLHLASHLYSAPEVAKNHRSLAEKRRSYRSDRRRLDRAKTRRKKCRDLLIDAGLVPAGADSKWFETRSNDADVIDLRVKALDEPLSERELARVLMYFCRHRGYIDQSASGASDSEDGKVLAAVAANRRELEENDYRTVGEMLRAKHEAGGRIRNAAGSYERCVSHDLLRDEASLIIRTQRELGRTACTPAFEAEYQSILSWLKPTYDRDLKAWSRVGVCTYYMNDAVARKRIDAGDPAAVRAYRRAAKATLTAEREAALENLAHVTIVRGGRREGLPYDVRMALYDGLFDPDKKVPAKGIKYKAVRSLMNDMGPQGPETMRADDRFVGVKPEEEAKTAVYKPAGFAKLQAHLGVGSGLLRRLVADRELYDDVAEAMAFASSKDSYVRRLTELGVDGRLPSEDLEAVRSLPYSSNIFNGYGARGRRALDMLIDGLKDPAIHNLYEAEAASGLYDKRNQGVGRSTLLPPFTEYDPSCTNPVVLHAAARFRKVFNQAVREFGKPDIVRIEFARDLKASYKARVDEANRDKKRAAERDARRALVAEKTGLEPSEVTRKLEEKVFLYDSQKCIDLYTGLELDYDRVVSDPGYAEVDHILPRSRSFNDRMANKVLTLASSNRNKRERTPYEWMTSGESTAPSWEQFEARVRKAYAGLPPMKVRNLLDTDFANRESEFLPRHLNDTRYMSRRFADWVCTTVSFPDDGRVHVFAVAGGATGSLRQAWDIAKDRADDRHHAVDAAIIAACDGSLVQKCAAYGAQRKLIPEDDRRAMLRDTMPWPGFADQVRAIAASVVPTRSESRDFSGTATEDTAFAFAGYDGAGKMLIKTASGDQKVTSNHVFVDGSTVKANGGMACLRLWLDADARPKGKVKGEYLCEPVYYSDLPLIRSGVYVPRHCKANGPYRGCWPEVPERVREAGCIVLHRGDVVIVDDCIGRYNGLNIATRRLDWVPVIDNVPVPKPIGKWGRDTKVEVVQEDPLGLCWTRVREALRLRRS